MNITVLTSSYPRFEGDGTAPFVRSISEGFMYLGNNVHVIAPYDEAIASYSSAKLSVHRFWYAPFPSWHIMGHAKALTNDIQFKKEVFFLLPTFFLGQLLMTLGVAIRQKSNLIHAHWVVPSGFVGALVARLLNVPLVVSLHGSDIFVAKHSVFLGKIARWVFQQADVVTACSSGLRDGALDLGVNPDRVHLIPWGADPVKFSPGVPSLERSIYGLSESDEVVLMLGRLVPKKGFDVIVRSLPYLLPEHPSLQVVIGGSGGQEMILHQLAEDLGVLDHVHIVGQIPWNDVPSFLNMCDIFVLPSVVDSAGNVDGLPTVLLEAMSTGCAIIASRIAGIPIVLEDGVNGILCAPGDVDAWIESLSRLLSDCHLRDKLGYAARVSVVEELNWIEVAHSILDLLN
jgi:glycosyltransferase involved in cell wall biosynthesis